MGAYAELDSLVALQFKAGGFSLNTISPCIASSLAGELRESTAGARLRRTARLCRRRRRKKYRLARYRAYEKPYVRVYSEERDRPTMLVVDQRINMFFGSRVSMKSVVAAEVAALAAWRVFHQGDRVGAFVFNDDSTEEIRMHRSRANVLRILDRIVRQNHLLRSDFASPIRPERLNEVLASVARVCHHDALIIIASDFDGADDTTRDLLMHLSQSNDVICCLAYDPLAVHLPAAEQLVVSNGELQVELQLGQEKVRKNILDASDRRIHAILSWQHELGVPVLPLSTAEDVSTQLRHLLGKITERRRL